MKLSIKYGLLLLLLCLTANAQTVEQANWTRIVTEDKNLSVAFPPNFIVDAEESGKSSRTHQIYGFQNDIKIVLKVIKSEKFAQEFEKTYEESHIKIKGYFTVGNFIGYRYVKNIEKRELVENIELVSKTHHYTIKIDAKDLTKEIVEPFLHSILIDGKPFFNVVALENYLEKSVSINSLETSPEVLTAYKREIKDLDSKPKTKPLVNKVYVGTEGLSRSAFIVEETRVKYESIKVLYGTRNYGVVESSLSGHDGETPLYYAHILVELLANGNIGEVTIYGTSDDKQFIRAYSDAIKKLKFIPAQKNGVNVNSKIVLSYAAILVLTNIPL